MIYVKKSGKEEKISNLDAAGQVRNPGTGAGGKARDETKCGNRTNTKGPSRITRGLQADGAGAKEQEVKIQYSRLGFAGGTPTRAEVCREERLRGREMIVGNLLVGAKGSPGLQGPMYLEVGLWVTNG